MAGERRTRFLSALGGVLVLAACGAADPAEPRSTVPSQPQTIVLDRSSVMTSVAPYADAGCRLDVPEGLPDCGRSAIRRYQERHGLIPSGRIDAATVHHLRTARTDLVQNDTARGTVLGRAGWAPPSPGDIVYAVEAVECGAGVAATTYYQGMMVARGTEDATVVVGRRFRFRYHTAVDGVDRTNADCQPLRRFCYGEAPNAGPPTSTRVFRTDHVVDAERGVVPALRALLDRACR